jgi:diguanylate cyclase (GGDEF)-like protein
MTQMLDPARLSPAPHRLENVKPLLERLQRALTEAKGAGEAVALLLVHAAAVDRVDALRGFAAGDEVAAQILEIVQSHLRKRDVIECVSRGQFACVLRPIASDGVAMLGACRILDALSAPMQVDGQSVGIDAAVGIATFPRQADDAGELMQRAKIALQAARNHHDRYFVYSHTEEAATSAHPLQYEDRLRAAIMHNRLALHFQPQVDTRTRRIIGAESLLRWNDETLGPVPPNVTVQAAESAGLMDELTMWVITNAIQHTARFREIDPNFHIGVNISPSNLREADLPYYVDRALRTWDVPGENMVIEITETAVMVEQAVAQEALGRLKSNGVKLSIDDFGTGYSSMYYLSQLPLDELKIDLMFVRNMLESRQHQRIVRSLIDLAHNLELKVVAEGVESAQILDALSSLDCDIAQGYHLGKALPPQELIERLRAAPSVHH